jgi:hypothetical protein
MKSFNSGLRQKTQNLFKKQINFFWAENKPQSPEGEPVQPNFENPFSPEDFQSKRIPVDVFKKGLVHIEPHYPKEHKSLI